jgi:hypothetical protein
MLTEAKQLLSKGISIIPIIGPTSQSEEMYKSPALKSWKEYQNRRPTIQEVNNWFSTSRYNMAIVTGQISKIFCLDIDERHNGYDSIKNFQIPFTWHDKSPNGEHYYFRLDQDIGNSIGILPGIDIKGNGGYVVVPPSIGYDGTSYEWIKSPGNSPLAYPPKWLLDLISSSTKNDTSNKQGWVGEALLTMEVGNIDNTLFKVLSRLRHDNYTKQDAFTLLKPYADERGATIGHLEEKIEHVWSTYTPGDKLLEEIKNQEDTTNETYSISSFLALEDKVTWIVPGIISDKSLGFIAGLPETGKTWICMDLAVECAKGGGYWLGKFPVKDAKVLYIDQERWKGETKRRLSAIIGAKSISRDSIDANLFIKSGTTIRLDLQHSFDAFRREVEKLKPDLIIVDSFATFHTKEENNRKDIQEVLERVKLLRNEFGCAFLFVDHEGKSVFSDEDKTPSMAKMVGSIGKPAAAEYVLTVRKESEDASMVYHTKSTLGKAVEPFLVKVEDLNHVKTKISVKAY